MADRYETVLFMRRNLGLTYREIGERCAISAARAQQMSGQAHFRRETRAGYLDSPEEFWEYERWGDRRKPRRPGFGYSQPRQLVFTPSGEST